MAVNKTGSTKHIATPPEEDQATATAISNMHEKLMKIGHVVPEGDMVADRQTHGHEPHKTLVI